MREVARRVRQLFSFHDVSPPMLLHGGHMRPMMHSILATMIMYYEERFIAHEMDTVLSSMRDAYAAKSTASPPTTSTACSSTGAGGSRSASTPTTCT